MRKVSTTLAATFAVSAILLSGCSGDQQGPGSRGAIPRQQGPNINDVFARGVELHEAEDCRKAVPHLYQAAFHGPGYEDAQWRLGECLMRRTPPAISSTQYLEGLMWTRRAAEAGWPEAQARLAVVYTQDDLMRPIEAAMWLTLADRNLGRSRIGFVPLSPDTMATIRARLAPSDIAEGEARANGWKKTVWRPPSKHRGGSFAGTKDRPPGSETNGKGRGQGKGKRGERPFS